MPSPTIQFGFKFRQPAAADHINNDASAPLRADKIDEWVRKAIESVNRTYQGWSQGEDRVIEPMVLLRTDPRYFYIDLLTRRVDQISALEWRAKEFNGARFGIALERGLRMNFERWQRGAHREAILVTHTGDISIKAKGEST